MLLPGTDLISELALAVTLELTAEQLLRPVRPHPTFAEAISEAVEAAFSPLLAPFFHKEASAAGGRLFSFHIHSLKFDHSRRSLPFFALSLTEVLSAGDITALPCRNLR